MIARLLDLHEIMAFVQAAFLVSVDETDVLMPRQHGGDRDQAEWRGWILRANQFAGFRIVPERVRDELWIDH